MEIKGDEEGLDAHEEIKNWVARRITGYLVFRTTLIEGPNGEKERASCSENEQHINGVVGRKWKKLSEEERKSYAEFAEEQRKVVMKEIKSAEYQENIDEFVENIVAKVKHLKKV